MSSPSQAFRAPACQESSDSTLQSDVRAAFCTSWFARTTKTFHSFVTEVLRRLGRGNRSGDGALSDDAQANLIKRYLAAEARLVLAGSAARAYGDPCCALVDVPGVGSVHAGDCQQVPEPLRSFISDPLPCARREKLLCRLLLYAKDMAEHQIEPAIAEDAEPGWCLECTEDETGGAIAHNPVCRTGRVLRVVAEILASPDFDLKGKETAPDGEGAQVGDGIRLRGLTERLCLQCGKRDGEWNSHFLFTKNFSHGALGLNQCVGVDDVGEGKTVLYTHRCAEGGAR